MKHVSFFVLFAVGVLCLSYSGSGSAQAALNGMTMQPLRLAAAGLK